MKKFFSLLFLILVTLHPVIAEETPSEPKEPPKQSEDESPVKGWSVKRKPTVVKESKETTTPPATATTSDTVSPETDADTAKPVMASGKPRAVYVVPIDGPIDDPVAYILRRAIKESEQDENPVIVLDINTPGGSVATTLDILAMLDAFPGDTIAYVNDEAMSAGSIISSVCKEIYYAPRGVIGAAAVVDASGKDIEKTMKMKIDSYMNAKMRAYTGKSRYRAEVIRAMMDSEYELVIEGVTIKPKGELLSLTGEEALREYGYPPQHLFGNGIAETKEALLEARYGKDGFVVRQFEVTWSETLAKFMHQIAPILMGLAFLLLFIEFKTPGFGIFGTLGIALLLVVFASSYVIGLAGYEPIILFFVGIVLIGLELFVLHGMVISGALGFLCIIASLIWALTDFGLPALPGSLPDAEPVAFDVTIFIKPLWNVILGIILGIIGLMLIWRILPKTSFYSKLVLVGANTATSTSIGDGTSGDDSPSLPPIGSQGVAVSDLRPGGDIEIEGKRYRAQLTYGMARRGDRVEVIEYRDLSLVVKAV